MLIETISSYMDIIDHYTLKTRVCLTFLFYSTTYHDFYRQQGFSASCDNIKK